MRFGTNHVTANGRKVKVNDKAIDDNENYIYEGISTFHIKVS